MQLPILENFRFLWGRAQVTTSLLHYILPDRHLQSKTHRKFSRNYLFPAQPQFYLFQTQLVMEGNQILSKTAGSWTYNSPKKKCEWMCVACGSYKLNKIINFYRSQNKTTTAIQSLLGNFIRNAEEPFGK